MGKTKDTHVWTHAQKQYWGRKGGAVLYRHEAANLSTNCLKITVLGTLKFREKEENQGTKPETVGFKSTEKMYFRDKGLQREWPCERRGHTHWGRPGCWELSACTRKGMCCREIDCQPLFKTSKKGDCLCGRCDNLMLWREPGGHSWSATLLPSHQLRGAELLYRAAPTREGSEGNSILGEGGMDRGRIPCSAKTLNYLAAAPAPLIDLSPSRQWSSHKGRSGGVHSPYYPAQGNILFL